MEKRFKLVRVMMGSGWPSAHVAINNCYSFPDKPGGGEMYLTLDAQDFSEFSHEIDQLISELEHIREIAAQKIDGWRADWQKARFKSD